MAVLGAIAALMAVAAVVVIRSGWFRETVRHRIIAEISRAANGKVETGAFRFSWNSLTAELDDLVIHGTEAAGEAPLLAVKRLSVGLKIISVFERKFDLAKVDATEPKVHLILARDGNTNIPPPKKFKPQTILDLKVRVFSLSNGLLVFENPDGSAQSLPFRVRGENLAVGSRYTGNQTGYDGSLAMNPVHLDVKGFGAADVRVDAEFSFAKNLLTIASLAARTTSSEFRLRDVKLAGFQSPVITGAYHARIALSEADRIFKLKNFEHTGTVDVAGRMSYAEEKYRFTGAAYGFGIGYGSLRNLSATTNFTVSPESIQLNGMIAKVMDGVLKGDGEVVGWDRFQVSGDFDNFRAGRLVAAAEGQPLPWDAMLSGTFQASGTLSESNFHSLRVRAQAGVAPAQGHPPLMGELAVSYDAMAATADFGPSWLALPQSRADFSGRPGSRLNVKLDSKDLNELRSAIRIPDLLRGGAVLLEGTVDGPLSAPQLHGHAEGRGMQWADEKLESLSADFDASSSSLAIRNTSADWNTARLRGDASVALMNWAATDESTITADFQLTNGEIRRLAALTGSPEIPVEGAISFQARLTGTVGDPHATADIAISKGVIYEEPFDTATVHAQFLNRGIQNLTGSLSAGSKRVTLSANFQHAQGNALAGRLNFTASSNTLALNQIAVLRKQQPDVRGNVTIKAEGSADLVAGRLNLVGLTGGANATALGLGTTDLGDAHLTAFTKGESLSLLLDSNALKAKIHGEGTIGLGGEYPVETRLTFSDVRLEALESALNPQPSKKGGWLKGQIAGDAIITGPGSNPGRLKADIGIRTLEAGASVQPARSQVFALRNDGPVRMTFSDGVFRVDNAQLSGPQTKVQISGTVSPGQVAPLDLRVTGTVGLALVHTFSEELSATGDLALNSTIRGTLGQPNLSGRAELHNGEFHYSDFANALTNANGIFLFSGNRATIQTLTAETGGGKVGITGFASVVDGVAGFRFEARGRQIRIRYPEGVSSLSDSDITLTGTSERSEASGKITIRRVSINPKSDAASMLARSVEPLRTPAARIGPTANLNLDIQIETAPDVAFETSVAQSLQADASLRLRGTATSPALLGRVNVTQGEIVAFGNKYTINQGSISFFNPAKIDPILNIDLETRSRGVDVVLTVSGPVSKLNVGYRSDPPLQFGDIVALLATGRTPGNATVAGAGGGTQAFQQLGASALVGQAISAPAPGRLERFFGVSRIKIDPQLTGITGTPQARLTVEQQITPNILFTYVSDVTNTNSQLVRVQFDFDRSWGAILTREANGYVGLDFAYKKRFK